MLDFPGIVDRPASDGVKVLVRKRRGRRDRLQLSCNGSLPPCAYLRLAKLAGANLSDANLEGAEGVTQAQLDRAHLNPGTKLPEDLTGAKDVKR